MNNKFKIKRAVFIYLLLHSAIIATLIILLARGGALPDSPLLAIAVITGVLALTLYTTHTVIQSMTDEITRREKTLSKTSADLQTALIMLGECAHELAQRIATISECGRELEYRANVINECNEKINILITMMGVADGSSAQTANGVANNKNG